MSKSVLQSLQHPLFNDHSVKVFVKRDDLIHPLISGNKWRKCHYLLEHMKKQGYKRALTFGGAYSNHIHAFAYACKEQGIESIGIIRGEELAHKPLNKTLSFAKECGMTLVFVSREEYQKRNNEIYQRQLTEEYDSYLVPEGGSTLFAREGFKEMLDEIRQETVFDYILVPCGSGGTIAGINSNLKTYETVVGINVLKGTTPDLLTMMGEFSSNKQYHIEESYHFGGYARTTSELDSFITSMESTFGIELEPVYSGKMFYAFFSLLEQGFFNGKTVILTHTGGLQSKRK